jgi:hypothetical protein
MDSLDLMVEHKIMTEFSDQHSEIAKQRDAKRYAVIHAPSGNDSLENNLSMCLLSTDDLNDARKFSQAYVQDNEHIELQVYDRQNKKVV